MRAKILYETDQTTVTDSTIIRNGEVYYINQIANMKITDDRHDIKRAEFHHRYEKQGYFWGFIKYLAIAVFFFLAGTEFGFFIWVGLIFSLIAFYKFIKWKNMPDFEEPELTYTLTINFSDGSTLKLYGNKEVIGNLNSAITQALHMS